MACRSVNNLRLSRDDMMRVYRDEALNCQGPIKIKHIIKILEMLGPIIPPFFRSSHLNANNNCNSGHYGMGSDRYGMGRSHNDMGSDYNDFGSMSYGNVGMSHHKIGHAVDFGERSISVVA